MTSINYEVNATFNVSYIIPFIGGIDIEAYSLDLRIYPSQEGGDDEIHHANGPTTRVMARRIQED